MIVFYGPQPTNSHHQKILSTLFDNMRFISFLFLLFQFLLHFMPLHTCHVANISYVHVSIQKVGTLCSLVLYCKCFLFWVSLLFPFFKFSFFSIFLLWAFKYACLFKYPVRTSITFSINEQMYSWYFLPIPFCWCRPPSTAIQWLYLDVHLMLFPVSIRRSESIIFLWL